MSVMCEKCGYVFMGHENWYGKVCTRCNTFIPTSHEMPIIKENKLKYKMLLHQALELIRKHQNANIIGRDKI